VSPWVLRGLRNGVVTTRWPARPDAYASEWRGPATIRDPAGRPPDGLDLLCPTRAIATAADGTLRLDQGRCILCGRCVAERPDVFEWSAGVASAALTRDGLVVPEIPDTEGNLAAIRRGLRARTAALRRSVHLRHVDAGSDGAVEQEIQALLNPVYDVHRLGIFFTASPRHADVLLVTGAGARGMTQPLRRTYDGMPDPKIVIAVGTDAVSGGLVSPSYATAGGVGGVVPVDVWLPGSPPSPFAILHALLLALGRLPGRPPGRPAGGTPDGPPGGPRLDRGEGR
jgi:Ni,Fe-hydrogenase III small subunit/ferredoxin